MLNTIISVNKVFGLYDRSVRGCLEQDKKNPQFCNLNYLQEVTKVTWGTDENSDHTHYTLV